MRLKPSGKPSVRLTVKENSSICFSSKSYIPVVGQDIEHYDGDYEVTPVLFNDTVLPTNGKLMKDDITVKEIPYWETSNPSGGTTVYIAMEE